MKRPAQDQPTLNALWPAKRARPSSPLIAIVTSTTTPGASTEEPQPLLDTPSTLLSTGHPSVLSPTELSSGPSGILSTLGLPQPDLVLTSPSTGDLSSSADHLLALDAPWPPHRPLVAPPNSISTSSRVVFSELSSARLDADAHNRPPTKRKAQGQRPLDFFWHPKKARTTQDSPGGNSSLRSPDPVPRDDEDTGAANLNGCTCVYEHGQRAVHCHPCRTGVG